VYFKLAYQSIFNLRMLTSTTFSFLAELDKNNNKPWFDANRPAYETARKEVITLAQRIIDGIGSFDAEVALAKIEPKSTISRINRDVRFSNNKSPYKNNFFAIINPEGKKSNKAGYYLEIKPGACFIGGGNYMPMPEDLTKIRQEIDYNFVEWKGLVEAKDFKALFPNGIEAPGQLSRPPKGFEADSEAIEYIKMKGFYTWKPIAESDLKTEAGLKNVIEGFKTSHPIISFLNRALES
jgi:uncharacterized protein (TIGR02453 family)